MIDSDLLEILYPEAQELAEADRAALRRDLFGIGSPVGSLSAGSAAVSVGVHDDATHRSRPGRPRRRGWLTAAAAVLLVLGVAGVWITAGNRNAAGPAPAQESTPNRGTDPDASPPSSDSAALPVPVALEGGGALLLDPIPNGWSLTQLDNRRGISESSVSTRIYATGSLQPERAPAFVVDVIDVDAGRPDIPGGAESVIVQGVTGSLYERPPGLAVSYETGGSWVTITGYRVERDALLTAAEHMRLDGTDAVIDPTALPADVTARAIGVRIEAWFIDIAATADVAPQIHWESDTGESMWLLSTPGTSEAAALGRIGAASVNDVDINGNGGFITTTAGDDQYRSLTWTADGHIYLLGSRGLDDDELVGYAAAMRMPTDAEWAAAVAAATPPMASVPANGGLPEPGSVVPYRVSAFPSIDETLVPDEGRGATYSYGTYSPDGIEVDGNVWIGTVGPADWDQPSDLVNVTVANDGLLEPSLGQPTRDPEIAESRGESSTELRTTIDGVIVQVIGADTDQLYEVIEAIRPTIIDGRLAGYALDGRPGGLVDLTGPTGTGWAAGALPTVHIHNGIIFMQVRPAPAITAIASGSADTERINVAGRTAYLFTSPDSPYQALHIEIDEHTTLTLTTADLERNQFLDIATHVELVDEATWNAIYDPAPAVIPTIESDIPTATPDD